MMLGYRFTMFVTEQFTTQGVKVRVVQLEHHDRPLTSVLQSNLIHLWWMMGKALCMCGQLKA